MKNYMPRILDSSLVNAIFIFYKMAMPRITRHLFLISKPFQLFLQHRNTAAQRGQAINYLNSLQSLIRVNDSFFWTDLSLILEFNGYSIRALSFIILECNDRN